MAGGQLSITKSRILIGLDNYFSLRTVAELQADRTELQTGVDLADRGVAKGVLTDPNNNPMDYDHVKKEVFGTWWPQFPDRQSIVRAGYIQAITLAISGATKRTIVSFWAPVATDLFEITVADAGEQVILTLVTPAPPKLPKPIIPGITEDLWLVASSQRVNDMKAMFPGFTFEAPVATLGNVVTQRLKSY